MVSLLYITNRNRDCMTWINNYWSIDGTNIQTGMIHPYNAHYSIIRWFTVFMILRDLYDKSFDNEYVLKRMSLRNESYGNILDVGVEVWTEKQDRKKSISLHIPHNTPPPFRISESLHANFFNNNWGIFRDFGLKRLLCSLNKSEFIQVLSTVIIVWHGFCHMKHQWKSLYLKFQKNVGSFHLLDIDLKYPITVVVQRHCWCLNPVSLAYKPNRLRLARGNNGSMHPALQ